MLVRRIVPTVPRLSYNRVLMCPLDSADRVVSILLGVGRDMPPNRMRIRIGSGNRLLFNQIQHREMPLPFWGERLAAGDVRPDSTICDIGCGCGRYASAFRRIAFGAGHGFAGRYTGIDIDPEMIAWCRRHFPSDRYDFQLADMYSRVYNPTGDNTAEPHLDLPGGSQCFVFSVSLFTHLLNRELSGYLEEVARVLRPAGQMWMTVFCMDDLRDTGTLGGRWTFGHRHGEAYVESERYPEAAVAYDREWLINACDRAGLTGARVIARPGQSVLVAHGA